MSNAYLDAAELVAHLKSLETERDELKDTIKCLEFNLQQKAGEIGRAEHRGNTVDYIYDKLENYSNQLLEVAKERNRLLAQNKLMKDVLKQISAAKVMGLETHEALLADQALAACERIERGEP